MERVDIFVQTDKEDLPEYATGGSAGADVRADLAQPLILAPGATALVPTGLFCEIPPGYEMQIRPRSGLALKNQVTVLNSPATIDSDYRGEIKVLLINHGTKPFVIEPHMRIAQLVVSAVVQAHFIKADELTLTARGSGGFGHTGVG